MIHIKGQSPFVSPKEREMGLLTKAIAILPANKSVKLNKMSRINFAKIYTVEHSVRVKNIGVVAPESMVYLEGYWENAKEG